MSDLHHHRMTLAREGKDWPYHEASQMIKAAGFLWHVQHLGVQSHISQRPKLLLVHGTGASTHSWMGVIPLLIDEFENLAIDMPGHAFTLALASGHASLPAMSKALHELLQQMDFQPDLVIGHSAGAAIAVRMGLDGHIKPQLIISLNGAFLPFEGLAGRIFTPIARLLLLNPFVPRLFAWSIDRAGVNRLMLGMGSVIPTASVDLYVRLFRNSAHVASVLDMLAHWELETFQRDLRRLTLPLVLLVGDKDKAVLPQTAQQIKARLPGVSVLHLPGLGHLAHEENPAVVADHILKSAKNVGLLPSLSQNSASSSEAGSI